MFGAYLALLGRILLLGWERIVVKSLGEKADSRVVAFHFFGIATLLMLPFVFFTARPSDYYFLIRVCISSLVYSASFSLYVKSLSMADASLVSPLYNFNVFFLLILTTVFLGESLTIYKIAGMSLLVYGASFLSRQRNLLLSLGALFKNRACLMMIVSSCLIAVGRTIDGDTVKSVSPLIYATCLYAGISLVLFLVVVISGRRSEIISLVRENPWTVLAAGAINSYSYLFLLISFTRIDVSVAEPSSMLSMVVTVFLARLIFREEIRERLIGVIIMIIGAWVLFYK
ncbi:MAG: DMT family transporter [Candidatus Wallbacteria bacterium]|nr:DMT family transporter [Candidatus Wallbacteria bacterium]